MSKFSKKLVSAALTGATVLSMSGALSLTAHAQSASDLQAQIAALLAQIASLQSQLNGGSTGGGSSVACTFTRTLTVGSRGADVTCLQNALIAGGYLAAGNNTGYFGGLTKAAVVKWQLAKGVSPASGLFGPLSRAAFAGGMGGNTGGNTGGNPGTVPATGLSVSAASTASGSAIAGAGQLEAGTWNLTAANAAGVTVTGLSFNKVGVVSDSQINNLYLVDPNTGSVIAQYSSLSNGVATFNNLAINVPAGQTVRVGLRMDLSSGASAGNTLGWALASVQTSGSVTVTGAPATSGMLTVTTVSNPALATVTWTYNAVGTTVDAGTNNVMIASNAVLVANSPVWMKSVKYTVVGSANYSDIRNLKLMVNGVQVGTTVAALNSDGTVTFNLTSNPSKLNTGNTTVDLYADIAGSPYRNFTVRTLRPYDVYFVDSQYNSGVTVSVTDNTTATDINAGQITVSLASDTPTGNIPKGASNVTLAKFTVFASGEAVKLKFVDMTITQGATGDTWTILANVTEDIGNVALIDDAGNQVGSTISTIAEGTSSGQCTLTSATVITCHFGTSGSPINYIVPANTTRVLSAKVDVKTTNDAPSLRAALAAGSSNLEGQTSFRLTNSGSASGAVLTVVNSPLSVAANGSFGAQTYVAGANGVKIGSFVFTASSAEGAKLNSITFDKDSNSGLKLQNMKVMVGSTQFGATKATIADTTESSLTFSGSPITVPAGGSVVVDVYADILTGSSAATYSAAIDYTSWTATGLVSNSSISAASAVSGQDVTISSGPTLTVATDDNANPSAKQVVMGSTGNTVMAARFTGGTVEDVKVTDLVFVDTISNNTSGRTSFNNMTLWDGATQLGGTLTPTISGSSPATVTFSLSTPLIVAKNTSKTLVLKGDVADFTSGAVSGSGHVWTLASSTITVYGKDSNTAATVSGSATGTTQTVYRSKLSLSSSVLGSTVGRARTAIDDLATVNWTANSSYQVVLNTVTVKFSGQAVSNGSTAFTVDLLKTDGTALGSAAQATCTPGAGNSCSVTFNPNFTISAGASQASKIRVNSGSFYDAASASESLTVFVNATTDVMWNDGTTGNIPLESSVVPFTIATVSY